MNVFIKTLFAAGEVICTTAVGTEAGIQGTYASGSKPKSIIICTYRQPTYKCITVLLKDYKQGIEKVHKEFYHLVATSAFGAITSHQFLSKFKFKSFSRLLLECSIVGVANYIYGRHRGIRSDIVAK